VFSPRCHLAVCVAAGCVAMAFLLTVTEKVGARGPATNPVFPREGEPATCGRAAGYRSQDRRGPGRTGSGLGRARSPAGHGRAEFGT
jgi:hypothetical protein